MEFTPSPEQPNPEITEFKDRFSAGLQDALDFFPGDDFLILQPLNLNIEDDARSVDELSTEEQSALNEIIIETLEIDFENQESIVKSYEFEGPIQEDDTPSTVKVSVYTTNKENLFLHKVTYDNGAIVYAVGPEDMEFQ